VKAKGKMSIVTVVSFGGSSKRGWKIAMARTVGSTVTLTKLGDISRDGMSFIPSPALRRMSEINGTKATEAKKEIGNEHGKT
jgi:hypothetical protein